jgi:hypothetical protein
LAKPINELPIIYTFKPSLMKAKYLIPPSKLLDYNKIFLALLATNAYPELSWNTQF